MKLRIAILRADGPHNRYLKKALEQAFNVVLDIEEQGCQRWRRLLRARKWRGVFDIQYQVFRRYITGLSRYRMKYFNRLADRLDSCLGPTVRVPWINHPTVAELLATAAPDVTIVMGCSVLKPQVLAESGPVTINIHGGYLPYYRGNHCFFFALRDGAYDRVGSTLHFVDPGVDTGDIIEVIPEQVLPHDNAETLYCRAEERAIHRLVVLLKKFEDGVPLPRAPQTGQGRTYKTADRTLWLDVRFWLERLLIKQRFFPKEKISLKSA